MTSEGSVTRWYRQLTEGDEKAIGELWDHFFIRLTELARKKLGAHAKALADEEDVALSAFKSLWQGAQRGQFGNVADRNELWRLLSTITRRKALDQIEFQRRQKRDVARLQSSASACASEMIQELASKEPSPDQIVQFEEEVQKLMARLPNPEYVKIALLRLEGATIPEIAMQLDRGHATIERKLKAIRVLWEEEPDVLDQ
jgi:DNA-directed RNA polymerase specialized sigma24 family protein